VYVLGTAALANGGQAEARRNLEESLQLHHQVGDKEGAAECLHALAAAIAPDDPEGAAELAGARRRHSGKRPAHPSPGSSSNGETAPQQTFAEQSGTKRGPPPSSAVARCHSKQRSRVCRVNDSHAMPGLESRGRGRDHRYGVGHLGSESDRFARRDA
jgi:hypothetical protein